MGGRRGIKLSPAGLLHFLGEREAKLIADGARRMTCIKTDFKSGVKGLGESYWRE